MCFRHAAFNKFNSYVVGADTNLLTFDLILVYLRASAASLLLMFCPCLTICMHTLAAQEANVQDGRYHSYCVRFDNF